MRINIHANKHAHHNTYTHTYRRLYIIDIEHFKSDITDFLNSNNITNETTEALLKQLLDKHSPFKNNYFTKHSHSPWYDSSLNDLKHSFRKLNRKYSSHPTIENLLLLKTTRSLYRKPLKIRKLNS